MHFGCWSLATQSQLVCSGCRNLLLYPVGATSVCCAVCNAVTAVPPPGIFVLPLPFHHLARANAKFEISVGEFCCFLFRRKIGSFSNFLCKTGTEMAQLVCGGCHTLLMYIRGATSVQCSCCHTVNLALEGMEISVTFKNSN